MTTDNHKKILMTAIGSAVVFFISCTNPAGPLSIIPAEIPTGITADPISGLVAGLDLDGDAILTNPDVVITGGVEWVPGLSGDALRTDSDGDFIRITDDSLSAHTIAGSVEAWVFPEGANYYTGIVHKGEQIDFSDEAWSLQFHADLKPYFYFVSENGTTVDVKAPAQIPLNTWSHLAATWAYDELSGDTVLTLYVNGTAVKTETRNGIGGAKASDGDVLIGSQLPEQYNGTWGHLTFMGLIDEVSLYNRARTAGEIEAAWLEFAPVP